jgi:hypothetical protein
MVQLEAHRPHVPLDTRPVKLFANLLVVTKTVFLKLSAVADHLPEIPDTQRCMQVSRRNIMPVVKVSITTFFLYTDLNYFLT